MAPINDQYPGGVTVHHWSATCPVGTPFITDPSSPNPTFTCGIDGAGVCTITVSAGLELYEPDGGISADVSAGEPNTKVSIEVECAPGSGAGDDASAR